MLLTITKSKYLLNATSQYLHGKRNTNTYNIFVLINSYVAY